MTRRTTTLTLIGLGLAGGAGWMAADQLRQPTPDELAQRACIAEVARTAHQADDSAALAAQAADCSIRDL